MIETRLAANVVILTGIATIVTMLLLIVIPGAALPPAATDHSSKFTNSMLWFELAKDADEVFANLGPADDPIGRDRRANLDAANQWDFGFMVAYSAFNGALVLLVWTLNRGARFWNGLSLAGAGIILAALMLVGDVLENMQLLRLTGFATADEVPEEVMRQLNVWTRVKWGAIFAETMLLAWGYAVYFLKPAANRIHRAGLIIAMAFLASAGSGIPSIAVESLRHWLEIASACIAIAWTLALAHAISIRFARSPRT